MHAKSPDYQRIATEEAFAPPELLEAYRKIIAKGNVDPGFKGLMGFYMTSPSDRAKHIMRCLTDIRAVPGSWPRWCDLRFWCGNRPARHAHHYGGRV
jgi:hypothetical protein